MIFMVTQKLNKYQEAKKQLEHYKRENKKLNIEKLKQQLFEQRQLEIKYIIDFTLLGSLINYFSAQSLNQHKSFEESEELKEMNLIKLRLALEQYMKDRQDYIINLLLDEMTPEINIIVSQRFERALEQFQYTRESFEKVAEYIEESTIYN